jgi:hypothetical protein
MTMRLLERRETVSELEQTLTRAKADLQREKTTSSGLWKQVKTKQEQLEQNLRVQEQHFEVILNLIILFSFDSCICP